jgi:steroid delta-isomerase-like uncharacterized protein
MDTTQQAPSGQQRSKLAARLKLVEEHVQEENRHALDTLMDTFGADASFDVNADHIAGRDAVRQFYAEVFQGFPDFTIDVRHTHASNDAVILETVVRGTHAGPFRGIPATGRQIEFPLCAVFPFDDDEKLAGERVYYDVALMLTQMGVLSPPAGS